MGLPAAVACHVLRVERPLRHIQGSPFTLALAVVVLIGLLLITVRPGPSEARPHRVGAWFLRILASLATLLACAAWWVGPVTWVVGLLGWLAGPVTLTLMVLSMAWVGHLHRQLDQQRLANLADLAGVVLPLLWLGSQLVSGYPGPALWGPGLGTLALCSVTVGALVPGALRRRSPREVD